MAKVRPQSQGISLAALVAFECLLLTPDGRTNNGLVAKYIDPSKCIVHTHQSLLVQVSASDVEQKMMEISISCLSPLRSD